MSDNEDFVDAQQELLEPPSKRRRLSEDDDESRPPSGYASEAELPTRRQSQPHQGPSIVHSRANSTPAESNGDDEEGSGDDPADATHLTPSKRNALHPSSAAAGDASSVQDSDYYTDQASSPAPHHQKPPSPSLHYGPKLILKGHKRAVAAVRFSPDGKLIASCSADATAKIWDAQSGKLQHTLVGHLAGISTLAWSPDSRTLATGSDDKLIRLWNVSSGRPHKHALVGHHNYVYSVAFSPRGNILVSGSYDEAVFLWDVRGHRLLRMLPAHSDPVGGVDFVRDGTLIASCSSDGLIRVWDAATGQCLRTFFHEDTPPVVGVRFSPNGKYILAWMQDSSLRMWNYIEGRCVKTYQGHKNVKYSLGGAFGSYTAVTMDEDTRMKDEQDESEDEEDRKRTPRNQTRAMVVSGSEDGRIVFWDVVSKEVLQRIDAAHGDQVVFGVDLHPTEPLMVSCGQDHTLKIWKDAL